MPDYSKYSKEYSVHPSHEAALKFAGELRRDLPQDGIKPSQKILVVVRDNRVYTLTPQEVLFEMDDSKVQDAWDDEVRKKGLEKDGLKMVYGTNMEPKNIDDPSPGAVYMDGQKLIGINPGLVMRSKTYVRQTIRHELAHYEDEKEGRGHKRHGKYCGGYKRFGN